MDGLISRAAAIDAIVSETIYPDRETIDKVCKASPSEDNGWVGGIRDAINAVEEVNAVDAAPVVHARWIEYPLCLGYVGAYSEDHIVCSNCKSVWSIIGNDTERFDYCPACGAKMDGDSDGPSQ